VNTGFVDNLDAAAAHRKLHASVYTLGHADEIMARRHEIV
jgi:hypothetical protein